ncbi:hypothetical protein [Streptomyces longwoodensis]|uniref:hypothetical protein n=1 Tax=Streptomyces longwoodensis TaxID=68231 RepID=UPI00225969ED|nr:hypothetical protein [Streptomyces longwoodensis]MCX5000965.1 hypothetical protein [Streptomyces longwoodensis]
MNELTQQMQQAYDRGGRGEARQTFLNTCQERDWTREELHEAVVLLRGFPTAS